MAGANIFNLGITGIIAAVDDGDRAAQQVFVGGVLQTRAVQRVARQNGAVKNGDLLGLHRIGQNRIMADWPRFSVTSSIEYWNSSPILLVSAMVETPSAGLKLAPVGGAPAPNAPAGTPPRCTIWEPCAMPPPFR